MMRSLKEWSSVVRALGDGAQHVLLRKGGILDEASGFRFDSGEFALLPTLEHESASDLRPEFAHYAHGGRADGHADVSFYARVAAEADLHDEERVRALSHMHIWSDDFVRRRMSWKPERPIKAALLRVYRAEPVRIRLGSEHAGCRSWVDINQELRGGRAVIDDARASELAAEFAGLTAR